jgi:site-specific recombinase XerD
MVTMIEALFPKTHDRYTSLPLLGSLVDDFALWLSKNDYRLEAIRVMLRPLGQADQWLQSHGIHALPELDALLLEACWSQFHRRNSHLSGVIRALARYLASEGRLCPPPPQPPTPSQRLLAAYRDHLDHVRRLAPRTIEEHLRSAGGFLNHLDYDTQPTCLADLQARQVETFVCRSATRLSRGAQQHLVAHLRSLLRFLVTQGQCPSGLDTTIDTPRLYHLEQLPRALPWDRVEALLQAIDRHTPTGLRDYTMLLLIAAYGLRVSEIVALTLDDIHWRQGWLQVPRGKTQNSLHLPLTDKVAEALIHYLRQARPHPVPYRALFLRSQNPIRPLSRTAVSGVFRRWAKRSGVTVPFYGAHCLRHVSSHYSSIVNISGLLPLPSLLWTDG